MGPFKDIGVDKTGHVALIEIRRPPHNFFDIALIQEIADALRGARRRRRLPRAWCWPRKARRSAPAPISATARRSTKTASGRRSTANRRAASLYRGQPAVPHQEADRRRDPRRGGRRRARPGDGRRLPRHLPRGALLRQLHAARLPSRLRPDRHAAGGDRPDQGGDDVLYQPPRHRRGGLCHGPCRRAGAAGPGARGGAEARRRDRREFAARR